VRNNDKYKNLIIASILAVLIFVAYLPVLDNGFTTWDDDSHLYQNETVRSLTPSNIKRIFTSSVYDSYCPLTVLSFAVEYHFVKLDPFYYHFNNVALHMLVTLLAAFLFLRLKFSVFVAFFAALIFGVHPMHVESVAWVTERKDVLYSLFYLLSILGYLNYADGKGKRFFVLSVLAGICAMLSKAMALSLPLVLIVIDWYRSRKWDPSSLLNKIPYALFVIPIAWITFSQNMRVPGRNVFEGSLVWIWTLMFYLRKFLGPWRLYPYYPLPQPIELANAHYYFAVVGFAFVLYCLYRFRRNRLWIFSFVWFFVSIFFLLRYDDMIDTTVVSDRYMYLPSLAFCVLLGVAAEKLLAWGRARGRVVAMGLLAVVLFIPGALTLKTFYQADVWQDGVTLWQESIRDHPQSHFSYYFRAHAFAQRGQMKEAIADYTRAIEIVPNFSSFHNDRGLAYLQLGRDELALLDFDLAIALSPQRHEPFMNMGVLFLKAGDLDQAETYFREALKRNPGLDFARLRLSEIYSRQGKGEMVLEDLNLAIKGNPRSTEGYLARGEFYASKGVTGKALADFARAIDLDPTRVHAFVSRGNIYYTQGLYDKALVEYSRAIELAPDLAEVYSNRGLAYLMDENFMLAVRDFDRALKLNPDAVVALDNRGVANAQSGLYSLALRDLGRSLELVPDNAATYFNRGAVYMNQGRHELALRDFEKCLELNPNFEPAHQMVQKAQVLLKDGTPADRPKYLRIKPTF